MNKEKLKADKERLKALLSEVYGIAQKYQSDTRTSAFIIVTLPPGEKGDMDAAVIAAGSEKQAAEAAAQECHRSIAFFCFMAQFGQSIDKALGALEKLMEKGK